LYIGWLSQLKIQLDHRCIVDVMSAASDVSLTDALRRFVTVHWLTAQTFRMIQSAKHLCQQSLLVDFAQLRTNRS